jgi:hypothetical protein
MLWSPFDLFFLQEMMLLNSMSTHQGFYLDYATENAGANTDLILTSE